nr:YbaK/EbsC family protein [Rubellimicrobium arenae]
MKKSQASSLQSVREFFAEHAPEIEVLVTEESSAAVALAAVVHDVEPAQIAKTICVRVGETTMLVVASGTARLDNRKFKDRFGTKPRMLEAEEVLSATSHPMGGVCPFGLPALLPVYCEVSLRAFEEVVPAADAINAAVRLTPERLAEFTAAEWVGICK